MKTKLLVGKLHRCLKISGAFIFILVAFFRAHSTHAASTAELLEKAIYVEETKGDIKAAGEVYQAIIDDPRAERNLVAQAQLRLGLCQLKLGNKPQAISALERLTQDFPDKDSLLAIVGEHMPQVLDEIVQQVERNYIQEVDRTELIETAIRAVMGKLDSRSGFLRTNDMQFLTANEMKQLNEQMEQKIAGIGAVLDAEAGEVVVRTPLAGSPAFDGGLRAGDRIIAINGTELPANSLQTAVKLLRGPVGTAVTIGVKRIGSEDLQHITLVRNTIRLPTVMGDRRKADNTWDFMLDEQRRIGYARLTYLGKESAEEMRAALDELKARGITALILDLRNNPGGLLDMAVAVTDLFVENGRIVTVKGRSGETAFDAKPGSTSVPLVVLVNRNTASAAEIIAAGLQDHGRAVVVGERSFGQAIVKSLFELKSGVGAVKLPVAAYYRPSGRAMNRFPSSQDSDDWGVRPDAGYEIAFTDEELKAYEKDRSARDVMNGEQTTGFHDRQLQKAVECLLAQRGN